MVYRGPYNRRSRRSRYRRRRRFRRYASPTYAQIGSKVFRDVQRLKNLINVEFKSHLHQTNTSPSTSGHVSYVTNVDKGDSISQRDGDQIRLKSIETRGMYTLNPSATSTTVRLMWVLVKNVNGATPAIGDIIETLGSSDVSSLRNLEYRRNVVILKDMVMVLNSDTPKRYVKYYRKMDAKLLYNGSATDVTAAESNSVFLVQISDEATNTPTVELNTRVRFIDN
jgi:hypothetical protein